MFLNSDPFEELTSDGKMCHFNLKKLPLTIYSECKNPCGTQLLQLQLVTDPYTNELICGFSLQAKKYLFAWLAFTFCLGGSCSLADSWAIDRGVLLRNFLRRHLQHNGPDCALGILLEAGSLGSRE